jgi:hypothetical protein
MIVPAYSCGNQSRSRSCPLSQSVADRHNKPTVRFRASRILRLWDQHCHLFAVEHAGDLELVVFMGLLLLWNTGTEWFKLTRLRSRLFGVPIVLLRIHAQATTEIDFDLPSL